MHACPHDNVALPYRKHFRLSRAEASQRALEKLALVHMEDAARRFPGDLGDGPRKRVAIARALALDPEFVIFDEPTTGLDPVAAANVDAQAELIGLRKEMEAAVLNENYERASRIRDKINEIQGDPKHPGFVAPASDEASEATDDCSDGGSV